MFILSILPFSSLAELSPMEKKEKQLCYFKNNHVRLGRIYEYRRPYFYPKDQGKWNYIKSPLTFISRGLNPFWKNPFTLVGIKIDAPPSSSKNGTITRWYTYKVPDDENPIDSFCRLQNGSCMFKVVISGYLEPHLAVNPEFRLQFKYKLNQTKAAIYDGQNNILHFPTDCSKYE